MNRFLFLLVFSLPFVFTTPAQAVTMLDAIDSGFYQSNNIGESGFHDPTNQNYLTGRQDFRPGLPTTTQNRSFFVFDLTSITGNIVSATLQLENPLGGFSSGDPSEVFRLLTPTTPIATLVAGGSGLGAIFSDLGSGVAHSGFVASAASNGTVVDIPILGQGLIDLNAGKGSLFAFSGSVAPLGSDGTQYVFGGTSNPSGSAAGFTRRLVLETQAAGTAIPEPSTVVMFGLGLGGLALLRLRKK